MKGRPSLTIAILAAAAIVLALFGVFFYAPVEKQLGFSQKIFYFHVPLAWNGLLAFSIVFIASILYLRSEEARWNLTARAAAEVGVIFTTLVLITGPIWGRVAWGAWWTWDPRLTTTLVLWLLYVGYLMLGQSIEEESRRARFSAVYGIVAFVDVPLVWFSIRWWRSIHPVIFRATEINLDTSMLQVFLFSLFAFTLVFVYLLQLRVGVEWASEEAADLKEKLGR